MSLLRNIQRVLFLLFRKRLIVPQARDLLGDFAAKLTLVWATLSRLVIGASVESQLSPRQSGALLRELISLAFRLGGPAFNEQ